MSGMRLVAPEPDPEVQAGWDRLLAQIEQGIRENERLLPARYQWSRWSASVGVGTRVGIDPVMEHWMGYSVRPDAAEGMTIDELIEDIDDVLDEYRRERGT